MVCGTWCLMSSPLEMLSGWLSALFKDFQTCTCCLSTRVVFSAGFFIIYLFLGQQGLDLVLGETKLCDGSDPWWDGAVGITTRKEEICFPRFYRYPVPSSLLPIAG